MGACTHLTGVELFLNYGGNMEHECQCYSIIEMSTMIIKYISIMYFQVVLHICKFRHLL